MRKNFHLPDKTNLFFSIFFSRKGSASELKKGKIYRHSLEHSANMNNKMSLRKDKKKEILQESNNM